MAAMAPWMWFVGFGVLVALELLFPNPILLIIAVFAGYELYRRWQARKSGSVAQAAYYRVSPRNRLLVGAVYIGLIAGARARHGAQPHPQLGHPQLPLAVGRSALRFAHAPFDLALGLALADRLALVVEVLAAGERDLDLRVRALRSRSGSAPASSPAR